MTNENIVELIASEVVYFSHNDEAAFFEWLNKLRCLEHFEGKGRNLHIYINCMNLDEDGLREIISLFKRYNIQLAQLSVFDNDLFTDWFRNKKSYWYKSVFD